MKTEISVSKQSLKNIKTSLLVLPFTSRAAKKEAGKHLEALGLDAWSLKDFKAAAGDTLLLYTGKAGLKSSRVLLAGLGEGASADDFRKVGMAIAGKAMSLEAEHIALDASSVSAWAASAGQDIEKVIEILVSSVLNGTYRFERLKSGIPDKHAGRKKQKKDKGIGELVLRVNAGSMKDARQGADKGLIIASCQAVARDLVNLPGNLLNAVDIARYATESGRLYGYKTTVFEKTEIERLGMGGLLAVNKGSKEPPTFSVLDYTPSSKPEKTVLLVGKGVTFDSGGISIKPANGMDDMKSDMAGAAAVIGTVEAAARMELPLRVIGVVPATDNMPGGAAQKPGDVITTYSGITVEVGNTDAEGRLILADALSYAIREYEPDVVVDLATLTGACIVALGYGVAGLFSNDDQLAASLYESGQETGEKIWRLPLWDEYDDLIKSDVADVHNTGGKGAGTITAAKFLQKFTEGHRHWAHLDIAGPSFATKPGGGKMQGGTGFGVSLLVDYLRTLQDS